MFSKIKTFAAGINRKHLLLILVALFACVGAFLAIPRNNIQTSDENAEQTYQQAANEVQQLIALGKFEEAEKILLEQWQGKLSKEQKYKVSAELAAVYQNLGNMTEALKWYRIAYEIDPDFSYSVALGIALLSDDKNEKITYYNKVIEIIKTNQDPGDNYLAPYYEDQIKYLQDGSTPPNTKAEETGPGYLR